MSSKQYHADYNLRRYHRLRMKYIDILGGKCCQCGSLDDLHFDHIDSFQKQFAIGTRITYPEHIVLEELKKCQLLCGKCHIEKTKISKDGYAKRAKGSRVNMAKLKETDIVKIKELTKIMSDYEISIQFGVSRKSIGNIRNGLTWKHV